MATNNQFTISGFVAVEATVKNFDNSVLAKFPLSISSKDTVNGAEIRKSALINVEVWTKNEEDPRITLLKKGTLVEISGFIKPDEYTDRNGAKQQRIIFVATSVAKPAAKEAPEKKPKGKTKTKAA